MSKGALMVKRIEYLERLESLKDKQLIKVVTGLRRCGKSTLLEQFRLDLLKNGVSKDQIISINFESLEFEKLLDYKSLYEFVCARLLPNKKNYIFLDEVQMVKDFQKAVDSLFIKENVDLYITGSNAHILSGELATLLSGRYIEIKMLPLSFKEYKEFAIQKNQNNKTDNQLFNDYINFSSMPYVLNFNDEQGIDDYLNGIVDTVLFKDIADRNKITDIVLLKKILHFSAENIGNIISPNKIAAFLTTNNSKTTSTTVENYLNILENTFIFSKVNRYDIKGKEYLKTLSKYYITDLGIRNVLLGRKNLDIGRGLENIIYLELIRRKYKVFTGKLDRTEIDFIALNTNETIYIQVCASALETQTLTRELRPLKSITDNHKKLLLTMDDIISNYDGIQKLNIINWLLKDEM
jgi:predicted AAA+ superfamily ATPase